MNSLHLLLLHGFSCHDIDLVSTKELDIITGARDGEVCSSGEVLREDYNRYMSVQTHRFGQPGRSYIGNYRTLIPYSEPPSEGTFLSISVISKHCSAASRGGTV